VARIGDLLGWLQAFALEQEDPDGGETDRERERVSVQSLSKTAHVRGDYRLPGDVTAGRPAADVIKISTIFRERRNLSCSSGYKEITLRALRLLSMGPRAGLAEDRLLARVVAAGAVREPTAPATRRAVVTGTDGDVMRGQGPDIAWFRDPAGNVVSVLQEA